MPLTVRFYGLKTCDTCRKAKRLLQERGAVVEELPIRESPPDREQLRRWMSGPNLRSYLNTSSEDYRSRGLSKRDLDLDQVLDLVAETPNLLRRPITVWGDEAEFGFDPERFEARLKASR